MDKALKKEDHRNIMENLSKEISTKIGFDGENIAITFKSLNGIDKEKCYDQRGKVCPLTKFTIVAYHIGQCITMYNIDCGSHWLYIREKTEWVWSNTDGGLHALHEQTTGIFEWRIGWETIGYFASNWYHLADMSDVTVNVSFIN